MNVNNLPVREGYFIRKNIDKWKSYQDKKATDPDELAHRYTDLVNDLGYAKTFYPRSTITKYLNELAKFVYLSIFSKKKEKKSRFREFWSFEVPMTVRKHHSLFLYSFLFFIFFAIIAVYSTAKDADFVRGVLGNDYIEMTEDNIAKGDPFGVYKNSGPLDMFFYIAVNNIRVSFLMFVFGALFSVGAVYLLFINGIMLGAFQYYFFTKGLGMESVLVIWIHGTLEILSIILSGGAGIMLGNSFLFPGKRSRKVALVQGARDGGKIMIALVPIFLVAAFLEGFITRYTAMPVFLSAAILLGSLAFMVWYFIVYPIQVERRVQLKSLVKQEVIYG